MDVRYLHRAYRAITPPPIPEEPEPEPEITLVAAGTWAELTASGSVTIPGSPSAGDLMVLWAAWKTWSITAYAAGWRKVPEFADGTTNAGNGTGSMKVCAFYKEHDGSESNPTLTFSASPTIAGAVIKVWRKSGGEWDNPKVTNAAIASATNWTATGGENLDLAARDVLEAIAAFRDNSATMTRDGSTGLTASGITWAGSVVESPATHLSTETGQDMAADLVHRIAASGTSSGAPTMAGALAADETGAALFIRHRIVDEAPAPPAMHYRDLVTSLLGAHLVAYWPCDEASGALTDRSGNGWTASAMGGSGDWTYGNDGPVINGVAYPAIQTNGNGRRYATSGSLTVASQANGRTWGAWVMVPSTSSGFGSIITRVSASDSEFVLWHNSSGAAQTIAYNNSESGIATATSGTDLDGGAWHLVLGWWDPADDDVRVQVDNGTVTTAAGSTDIRDNCATAVVLGATSTGGSALRNGSRIAHAFLIGRVLTVAERTALYTGVLPA